MADRDWTMDASITSSKRKGVNFNPSDTITSNVDLAYVGLGGPNCKSSNPADAGSGHLGPGNCFYYNNFQTSVFDPVT